MPSCGGAIGSFFFQGLAGIRPDQSAPGFKKRLIKPQIVDRLEWVRAHYESSYGRIESNWRLEGDVFSLSLTIPENTSATVFFPTANHEKVRESGRSCSDVLGVRFLRSEKGYAIYEIGSGRYEFTSIYK